MRTVGLVRERVSVARDFSLARGVRLAWLSGMLLVCLVYGCRPSDSTPDRPLSDPPSAEQSAAPSARPRVVILGDSLTAGLGLPIDASFPSLLQERLEMAGYRLEVVNAGVSGDTSAGGVRRLDWALDGDVRILIVALGGNDGLRGLPVDDLKRNLSTIIERAQGRGIEVVLTGMEAPPNYGPVYTATFRQAFKDLAQQHQVAFLPFLLDGVAGATDLNQGDGIHPNAAGARIVADHVWAVIEPLVRARAGVRS